LRLSSSKRRIYSSLDSKSSSC